MTVWTLNIYASAWWTWYNQFFMDFRSIATERISCDSPSGNATRLVVRYGGEKRVAFQTPRMRVRAVSTTFNTQLHRIMNRDTVPHFESFLGDVLSRVQSSAGLSPQTRVENHMQHVTMTDDTMVYGPDGMVYDDDIVQGNEYMVACIVALTGVWLRLTDAGGVASWGPVWEADQVKLYDTVHTRAAGRVFFEGKPFFRLDN
jgi:hypothetical protein